MARIRKIEIEHFRSIQSLVWHPGPGINCLIGPGDSGKSTILDAVDWCMGARRSVSASDTDFYGLDVSRPIVITLTLGELSDRLKSFEVYGDCLRGFDSLTDEVHDEPGARLETVLSLRLTINSDLEPMWSLYSERTAAADPPRMLQWKDRVALAPVRLGQHPSYHLSWTRGSVLNRLSEERAEVGAALVQAARDARHGFGAQAAPKLSETLGKATEAARVLGIPVGTAVTALLDAHAVSFGDGMVALHSEAGVPLRNLGTGSARLMIAALHREAAGDTGPLLIDEVEHGLEPHRIHTLLGNLGAKASSPVAQVFMTSHSPAVLSELSAPQLRVVRAAPEGHQVLSPGTSSAAQGAIRSYPAAFLAKTILICEGASEVGLLLGIDRDMVDRGGASLKSLGIWCLEAGGGDADRGFSRAEIFLSLGFRVAVFQDNDKAPTAAALQKFVKSGGELFTWREGRALEDELFASLPAAAVGALLDKAQELTEDGVVNAHIATVSNGKRTLEDVLQEGRSGSYSDTTRELLGRASRMRKNGWFKSVGKMEMVSREIVCPNAQESDTGFTSVVRRLLEWCRD
ncbi:ATP-binding protein [Stenotrophomonas sp. S39]|uniref:ATP-dependent nuclease n=1 Tax=Stenotrophomonas sp. S39 TaxID=2767451 RepID=UPI00190D9B52|nr:ATP-binding protein [Stenotrophomonas sp. S39]MBK0052629.1 AAA family ATPase [Stenotrophomonas sp. S39]